jgi:predicted membrane channel-forming protein YqfA (hemolysin III family)
MKRFIMANNHPTPPLHLVMIVVSALVLIAAMFFYAFAPPQKEDMFGFVIASIIGFITGKLTNSFGKPFTG